jgi:UDP-GlcNAc:undecaprenyl-phosphate GlcNAc-1-phosphate transferase
VTSPAAVGVAVAAPFALALSAVLTELCRRLALRYGLTDRPGGHKGHARPTPYLGGVALTVATVVGALAVTAVAPSAVADLVPLLAGGLLVSATGLVDDLRPLRIVTRLGLETLAAGLVVVAGVRLDVSGQPVVDGALTVTWIVLLTNSFNLLDNMDGAAASMGGATAAVLGVAALATGAGGAAALLGLAGACAGFLLHNRPPARIFMGDAGSLFLGFTVAVGAAAYAPAGALPAAAVLALVGFGPLVDTTLVMISRRRAGTPWYVGGTDHASHRLRRLGLTTGQVAIGFAVVAAASTGLGALAARGVVPPAAALPAATAAGALAVVRLLRAPVSDLVPGRDGAPVHAD